MKRICTFLLACLLCASLFLVPAAAYDAQHRMYYGTASDDFWADFQAQLQALGAGPLVGPIQESTFHSLAAWGAVTVFADSSGAKGYLERIDLRMNTQEEPLPMDDLALACRAALAPCAPGADFAALQQALGWDDAEARGSVGRYAGDSTYVTLHRQDAQWDFTISAAPEDPSIPHTLLDQSFPGEEFDPVLVDGVPMLPLRAIGELQGASIAWKGESQSVTVQQNGASSLQIGSRRAVVRGKPITLPAAPLLLEGRTLVPLAFLRDALFLETGWDVPSQVAILCSEGAYIH